MIEITKNRSNDIFAITQTKRIAGIDFHQQMSLTPEEMSTLCEWFGEHFLLTPPCTSLEEVKDRLFLINRLQLVGKVTYTEFNGKLLSSNMTRVEINDKVFGKLEDRK